MNDNFHGTALIITIFFHLSPTSSHLHLLQVENCGRMRGFGLVEMAISSNTIHRNLYENTGIKCNSPSTNIHSNELWLFLINKDIFEKKTCLCHIVSRKKSRKRHDIVYSSFYIYHLQD